MFIRFVIHSLVSLYLMIQVSQRKIHTEKIIALGVTLVAPDSDELITVEEEEP